jgi:hypothetical protein
MKLERSLLLREARRVRDRRSNCRWDSDMDAFLEESVVPAPAKGLAWKARPGPAITKVGKILF